MKKNEVLFGFRFEDPFNGYKAEEIINKVSARQYWLFSYDI
jgi:hypothetical protein